MEDKNKAVSTNTGKYEKEQNSRRGFLKKAAYSTPVLIAMGQLAKPIDAQADGTQSGQSEPVDPPEWW